MDERHQQLQPLAAGPRIINLVGDQRANNLVNGHFGRLSYVPLEDVDGKDSSGHSHRNHGIGKLHVNRIIEQTQYSFRELPPFETWYPSTRSVLSGDGQQVTKHLAWLWKTAPEAVAGTIAPWNGLKHEIKAVTSTKQDEAKLPLLACGEITNMQGWDISSSPAIAMAAGHSGHILRVIKVQSQEVYWKPADGTSITIDAFNAEGTEEGHWCGGSLPIRQIQFVACHLVGSVSRLILVQTSTATTFFEPVLQTAAIQEHDRCGYVSKGPSTIAISPIMQISAEETGGEAHCDAAFRPGSEDKMSQVAIIDERGNWSVWDIKVNSNTNTDRFYPVFVVKGNFLDDMPSMRSLTGVYERRHLHRIAWLPSGHKQTKFPPPPKRAQTAHSTSVSNSSSSTLMLLNAAYLKTVDVKTRKNLQMFGLTSHDGIDMVLDMQPCPTKSTRIFVLTTTTLFWLDLEPSMADQKTQPNPPNKVTRPTVLLSCPHLRDPTEKTLKLCVAPLGQLRHRGTCLVLVYSTIQAEMDLFWLTEGAWGGQASFRQQLFRFNPPPNTPKGTKEEDGAYGEQTLLAFPRDFAVEHGSSWKHRRRHIWQDSEKLRVFQFLRLGEDLGLRSSVGIRSPTLDSTASLFLKRVPMRIRRKARKLYNNSFVVPDGMVDPLIAEQQKPRSTPKPTGLLVRSTKRDFRTMDLSGVFNLLSGRVATVSETAREAADVVRGFQNPSPVDVIRRIIEVGLGSGSYPFTTLLDAVEDNFVSSFGADLTDLGWAQRLSDLDMEMDRRVYIYGQMNEGVGVSFHDATTLYEAIADMCETADEAASARLPGLLEVATVRLFLSLISMAVAPRPAVVLGNSIGSSLATPALEESKSPALPTPETWHSAIDLDMPSSPLNIPNWLQFSQEVAEDPAAAVEIPAEAVEEAQIEVAEDATIARLRQYALSIKTEPPRTTSELSLLSHWQLGSDPSQFWWRSAGPTVRRSVVEDAELAQIEEDEARERRRKRNEKLAARERERMMRMGVEEGGSMDMSLRRRRIQHSQQMMDLPPMPSSPAPMASQVFSSQVFPSSQMVQSSQVIVSSQPFGGGLHSSRAKKKSKRKGGFR